MRVRSSFGDLTGTWVREEDERMEKAIISGVTHDVSEGKLTISDVPDRPGIAARVFRGLADEGINVDMIVQNVSTDGTTDISFTVPREDGSRAKGTVEAVLGEIGAAGVSVRRRHRQGVPRRRRYA